MDEHVKQLLDTDIASLVRSGEEKAKIQRKKAEKRRNALIAAAIVIGIAAAGISKYIQHRNLAAYEQMQQELFLAGMLDHCTPIAAGVGHTVAVKNDGSVVATGRNDYGQCNVESWQNIISVAAGEE